jgi:hypothetical protein
MDNSRKSSLNCLNVAFFLVLTLQLCFAAACAPIKNLEVWKDDAYTQPLQKVLVIALAQEDSVRKQFENVLANQLADHGVEVIRSYKVLPDPAAKPDRDVVLAKVIELGVDSVFVARSISKKEITNHQYGGVFLGGSAVYSGGDWYGYSYGYSYDRQYDTDFFTVSTKLYDVDSKKPVWSYISQVRVDETRQGAVNLLVPSIVEQLRASQLIK